MMLNQKRVWTLKGLRMLWICKTVFKCSHIILRGQYFKRKWNGQTFLEQWPGTRHHVRPKDGGGFVEYIQGSWQRGVGSPFTGEETRLRAGVTYLSCHYFKTPWSWNPLKSNWFHKQDITWLIFEIQVLNHFCKIQQLFFSNSLR